VKKKGCDKKLHHDTLHRQTHTHTHTHTHTQTQTHTLTHSHFQQTSQIQKSVQESGNATLLSMLKKVKNRMLDLSNGILRNLPIETVSNNMCGINLSKNHLVTIPKKLILKMLQMPDLTSLNLSSNGMVKVPKSLAKLEALVSLDLSYNQLDALPSVLGNLSNLKDLQVKHNPLTTIPDEILKKGTSRIMQYLRLPLFTSLYLFSFLLFL